MKIETISRFSLPASWFLFDVSSLDVEVIIHLISDNDWINQLTLLHIYGDGQRWGRSAWTRCGPVKQPAWSEVSPATDAN